MGNNLLESPELAIDRQGRRFMLDPQATHFVVEILTAGRSYVLRDNGDRVLVNVRATQEQFEELVRFRPGLYRLRQVDEEGNVLEAPAAYIEIEASSFGAGVGDIDLQGAFAICHRLAQANEHKDSMLSEMTKTLMHTHVQLQMGAARMLEAATATIRVANGIESVERGQTVIDVDRISEHIIEALDEREPPAKQTPPYWVQILASPVGVRLLSILERAFPDPTAGKGKE